MTQFEYEVKMRLMQINKTQTWLAEQVRKDNGGKMDSGHLTRILKGQIKSRKNTISICKILGINPEKYIVKKEVK